MPADYNNMNNPADYQNMNRLICSRDQAFSQKWQFFQKCSYPKKNCSYIQNHTVTHFSRSLD